ncbi:MAG: MarC family protein [bacterium]
MEWFRQFLLAMLPLFVAIDPIGLIPIYLGISQGIEEEKLRSVTRQAIGTAALVALVFVFLGKLLFEALGITVADFKLAGGLILLALATRELVGPPEAAKDYRDEVGVVPLGTPLLAGPAAITTLLILVDASGVSATLAAFAVNLALVYLAFRFGSRLRQWIGITGLKAFSKIIALLLAAIAVNMMRRGFQGI